MDTEDWLWIALPTFNLFALHFWYSDMLVLLGPSAWVCWSQCVLLQWMQTRRRADAAGGNLMAMSLIPSLLHAVAMTASSPRWILYAKWTTLSALPWVCIENVSTYPLTMHPVFYKHRTTIVVMTIGIIIGFLYNNPQSGTTVISSLATTCESIQWMLLHWLVSSQQRFFVKREIMSGKDENKQRNFQMATWGEYQTLVFLLVIGLLEWQRSLILEDDDMDSSDAHSFYRLVALSGVVGCLLTVGVVTLLFRRLSLPYKVLTQSVGPLATVELCLKYRGYMPPLYLPTWTATSLPLCIQWLLDFFVSTEPQSVSSWPRYFGVVYWGVALVLLAAPTAWIVQRQDQSVVITRKWFHFVAIVLFTPTTHYFPQLMSLGYAVALCGLIVLETLRHSAPLLNVFYQLVHDPTKDNLSEGIILSHICLILGCAIPLWLSEAMDSQQSSTVLLSQWGILCLGVGDAMGAVVGKTWGRTRWGKNHRTTEGSLAMWASMMLVGVAIVSNDWIPLLVATTFSTMLEAYTMQMDNLVLPVAGVVWLVVLRGKT